MASAKCVHKGCGKTFSDPEEPCVYHPGPPEFHEGHKGWKCCKPRVLSFDEFLSIPPCTTGKHSTVDDTPVPQSPPVPKDEGTISAPPRTKPISVTPASATGQTLSPRAIPTPKRSQSPGPALESESDDPSLEIPSKAVCRRRGCNATYEASKSREDEECIHHPGQPLFHEGAKGWTCCKKRVLDFDEFMTIEGCKTRNRHIFIGKSKKGTEEKLETVRNDFYQTPTTVIVSFYLKKIDKPNAKVAFPSPTSLNLDLPTTDSKRYIQSIPLFAPVDQEKSSFKIMGTKIEFELVKADGSSWPLLRSDEERTGEIIQVGRASRA